MKNPTEDKGQREENRIRKRNIIFFPLFLFPIPFFNNLFFFPSVIKKRNVKKKSRIGERKKFGDEICLSF